MLPLRWSSWRITSDSRAYESAVRPILVASARPSHRINVVEVPSVTLTCPNCGNDRNFQVKTLQMHVVHLEDGRVEVSEESRPAVLEVLCDECESALKFEEFEDHPPQGSPADDRRALSRLTLYRSPHLRLLRSSRNPDTPIRRRCGIVGFGLSRNLRRLSLIACRRIVPPQSGHSRMSVCMPIHDNARRDTLTSRGTATPNGVAELLP